MFACSLLLRMKTARVLQLKYRRQKPQQSLAWHSSSLAPAKKTKPAYLSWFSWPQRHHPTSQHVWLLTALHVAQNNSVPGTSYLICSKQGCICTASRCCDSVKHTVLCFLFFLPSFLLVLVNTHVETFFVFLFLQMTNLLRVSCFMPQLWQLHVLSSLGRFQVFRIWCCQKHLEHWLVAWYHRRLSSLMFLRCKC